MFLYPNAKINIGLNIINKLKSGYHEIESCFCPVSLYDIIEVNTSDKDHLTTSGIDINSDISDNILIKCLKKFNSINKFRIHLHKKIPVGAGLGGGSSDAAFFLNFLNNNTQGKLTNKQLFQVANEIGSDCPFFLENKKKYVTGTGNILNEIKIDIKNKFILIVDPEEPINTTEAYNNVIPNKPKYDLRDVLFNENIENWSKYVKNDFENFAFKKIKKLNKIKELLIRFRADFVSLSGSGSCIYGIFNTDYINEINFPKKSFKVKFIE